MGPMTYALCQKPVIGIAMFVASLCAFPPLILNEPLSLATAGAAASKEFVVPVDKSYSFDLAFAFPSLEAIRRDDVVGRPIPIHVWIKRKADGRVVVDKTFVSLLEFANSGADHPTKWRKIGRVDLARGEYRVEMTNLEAQAGLDGVTTSFSLVGGHGK